MITVRVQMTDYEGGDFHESDQYPEYVARRLLEFLGSYDIKATVDVGSGFSQVRVFGIDNGTLRDEAEHLIKITWWDDFCCQF